jgi:hypothetical protein
MSLYGCNVMKWLEHSRQDLPLYNKKLNIIRMTRAENPEKTHNLELLHANSKKMIFKVIFE